mmetsp:Transcript_111050/g.358214  ORF Transcript_111050/g.358214 Transcript_111050/m.358214 type:complete len:324 (+) Transcript_111050:798-1769(+)
MEPVIVWAMPREEDGVAVDQAARGEQRRDRRPDRNQQKLPVDDVNHHRGPEDGGQQITLAQGFHGLQFRRQRPGLGAVWVHGACSTDHDGAVGDGAGFADGRGETGCGLEGPIEEARHNGDNPGGPMPGGCDFEGLPANREADEEDDRVQHLGWEDGQEERCEPREADRGEGEAARERVANLGAHSLEGAVTDEHRHAPRRAEQAGDDRGEAVAQHRPAQVVIVACILRHLTDLYRSDGHRQRHGNRDAQVADDDAEVVEYLEMGHWRVPANRVHRLVHILLLRLTEGPSQGRTEQHGAEGRGHLRNLGLQRIREEPGEAHGG